MMTFELSLKTPTFTPRDIPPTPPLHALIPNLVPLAEGQFAEQECPTLNPKHKVLPPPSGFLQALKRCQEHGFGGEAIYYPALTLESPTLKLKNQPDPFFLSNKNTFTTPFGEKVDVLGPAWAIVDTNKLPSYNGESLPADPSPFGQLVKEVRLSSMRTNQHSKDVNLATPLTSRHDLPFNWRNKVLRKLLEALELENFPGVIARVPKYAETLYLANLGLPYGVSPGTSEAVCDLVYSRLNRLSGSQCPEELQVHHFRTGNPFRGGLGYVEDISTHNKLNPFNKGSDPDSMAFHYAVIFPAEVS